MSQTELEELLKCQVCGKLCVRGVTLPCCMARACRACATKKVMEKRSCWMCSEPASTTDLVNNNHLRAGVKLKQAGQPLPLSLRDHLQLEPPEQDKLPDLRAVLKARRELARQGSASTTADDPLPSSSGGRTAAASGSRRDRPQRKVESPLEVRDVPPPLVPNKEGDDNEQAATTAADAELCTSPISTLSPEPIREDCCLSPIESDEDDNLRCTNSNYIFEEGSVKIYVAVESILVQERPDTVDCKLTQIGCYNSRDGEPLHLVSSYTNNTVNTATFHLMKDLLHQRSRRFLTEDGSTKECFFWEQCLNMFLDFVRGAATAERSVTLVFYSRNEYKALWNMLMDVKGANGKTMLDSLASPVGKVLIMQSFTKIQPLESKFGHYSAEILAFLLRKFVISMELEEQDFQYTSLEDATDMGFSFQGKPGSFVVLSASLLSTEPQAWRQSIPNENKAEDKVDKYTKAAAKCTSDTNSSVVGRSISVIGSDDKWRAAFKTGLFGFNQPVLVSMGPAWKVGPHVGFFCSAQFMDYSADKCTPLVHDDDSGVGHAVVILKKSWPAEKNRVKIASSPEPVAVSSNLTMVPQSMPLLKPTKKYDNPDLWPKPNFLVRVHINLKDGVNRIAINGPTSVLVSLYYLKKPYQVKPGQVLMIKELDGLSFRVVNRVFTALGEEDSLSHLCRLVLRPTVGSDFAHTTAMLINQEYFATASVWDSTMTDYGSAHSLRRAFAEQSFEVQDLTMSAEERQAVHDVWRTCWSVPNGRVSISGDQFKVLKYLIPSANISLGFNDAKAVLKTLDENFLCHNYSEQQQQQPGAAFMTSQPPPALPQPANHPTSVLPPSHYLPPPPPQQQIILQHPPTLLPNPSAVESSPFFQDHRHHPLQPHPRQVDRDKDQERHGHGGERPRDLRDDDRREQVFEDDRMTRPHHDLIDNIIDKYVGRSPSPPPRRQRRQSRHSSRSRSRMSRDRSYSPQYPQHSVSKRPRSRGEMRDGYEYGDNDNRIQQRGPHNRTISPHRRELRISPQLSGQVSGKRNRDTPSSNSLRYDAGPGQDGVSNFAERSEIKQHEARDQKSAQHRNPGDKPTSAITMSPFYASTITSQSQTYEDKVNTFLAKTLSKLPPGAVPPEATSRPPKHPNPGRLFPVQPPSVPTAIRAPAALPPSLLFNTNKPPPNLGMLAAVPPTGAPPVVLPPPGAPPLVLPPPGAPPVVIPPPQVAPRAVGGAFAATLPPPRPTKSQIFSSKPVEQIPPVPTSSSLTSDLLDLASLRRRRPNAASATTAAQKPATAAVVAVPPPPPIISKKRVIDQEILEQERRLKRLREEQRMAEREDEGKMSEEEEPMFGKILKSEFEVPRTASAESSFRGTLSYQQKNYRNELRARDRGSPNRRRTQERCSRSRSPGDYHYRGSGSNRRSESTRDRRSRRSQSPDDSSRYRNRLDRDSRRRRLSDDGSRSPDRSYRRSQSPNRSYRRPRSKSPNRSHQRSRSKSPNRSRLRSRSKSPKMSCRRSPPLSLRLRTDGGGRDRSREKSSPRGISFAIKRKAAPTLLGNLAVQFPVEDDGDDDDNNDVIPVGRAQQAQGRGSSSTGRRYGNDGSQQSRTVPAPVPAPNVTFNAYDFF